MGQTTFAATRLGESSDWQTIVHQNADFATLAMKGGEKSTSPEQWYVQSGHFFVPVQSNRLKTLPRKNQPARRFQALFGAKLANCRKNFAAHRKANFGGSQVLYPQGLVLIPPCKLQLQPWSLQPGQCPFEQAAACDRLHKR